MVTGALHAQDPWPDALAAMPVAQGFGINRTNAVEVVLRSFRSNATVKAVIFLPSVADDFYLINRGRELSLSAGNCRDLVMSLTNRTALRATFVKPFLLLHLSSDNLRNKRMEFLRPSR